jgi:hypothetical protein
MDNRQVDRSGVWPAMTRQRSGRAAAVRERGLRHRAHERGLDSPVEVLSGDRASAPELPVVGRSLGEQQAVVRRIDQERLIAIVETVAGVVWGRLRSGRG